MNSSVSLENNLNMLGPRDTNSLFLCVSVPKPRPKETVAQSFKILMTVRAALRLISFQANLMRAMLFYISNLNFSSPDSSFYWAFLS